MRGVADQDDGAVVGVDALGPVWEGRGRVGGVDGNCYLSLILLSIVLLWFKCET